MAHRTRTAAAWACVIFFLLLCDDLQAAAHRDPWKVLGVRRSATKKEITQAFRRLSREWHPDKNTSPGATEKFQEISAAYEYLTDPNTQYNPYNFGTDGPDLQGGFNAAGYAYNIVLDLDPVRMVHMVQDWIADKSQKYWGILGPLWVNPVDQAVCTCLEAAWKLPGLLEPGIAWLAHLRNIKYEPRPWRTWKSSAALLELSFWVGRQSPCREHHKARAAAAEAGSSSGSGSGSSSDNSVKSAGGVSDGEVLLQLRQQLHRHRKLRRQLLYAEGKKRGGGSGSSSSTEGAKQSSNAPTGSRKQEGSSSSSVMEEDFAIDPKTLHPNRYFGVLLWGSLLAASAWLLLSDWRLMTAGLVTLAVGIGAVIGWGGLLTGDESAGLWLAAALENDTLLGWLVGYLFVASCLFVFLALPVLLFHCLVLLACYIWANVTFMSLAMTPVMSRAGLAGWMLLKVYLIIGGDLYRGGLVVAVGAYLCYSQPRCLRWLFLWLKMLVSPALLILYYTKLVTTDWGVVLGLLSSTKAAKNAPEAQPQSQQQQGAAPEAEAAAGNLAKDAARTRQPQQRRSKSQNNVYGKPAKATAAPATVIASDRCAADDPAVDRNGSAGLGSNGSDSSGSNGSRSRPEQEGLLGVPFWPNSFDAADLAVTVHWWVSMLGWYLPKRVLEIGIISSKLTGLVGLSSLAAAAIGLPTSWLTSSRLVQVLLLKAGFGIGILVVGYKTLDDLARFMDPAGPRKQQKKRQKQKSNGKNANKKELVKRD